jgi:hypothetical protein
MKVALLISAACVATASASGLIKGVDQLCINGKEHLLEYNAKRGDESVHIYNLDDIDHVSGVTCDIDGSKLGVEFTHAVYMLEYFAKWEFGKAYLVGGSKWGCPLNGDPKTGLVLRYVNAASVHGSHKHSLKVSTTAAQYDQIYESATIALNPTGQACELEKDHSKDICLGLNTDDCKTAAANIPIYSNKYLTIDCDDCFAAFDANVFFNLEIGDWELQKLAAGFRNITLTADVDLHIKATNQWSTGVDKVLPIVPKTPLITFRVGSVPFVVWFDIPVEVKADAMLLATAEAYAGVKAEWNVGDLYIQWDPTNHWTHVTPKPIATFTPTISGHADFHATADFSLVPTFELHAEQLFTYTVTVDPEFNLDIKGDTTTKQLCENAAYSASITTFAELKLNINLLNIHIDKKWGPEIVWSKQGQLSQACINGTKF